MAKERILAVDDEDDILELVAHHLSREGYAVTCVGTGEEALKAVHAERPDLIVLDLLLPGVDGLAVCRRLKADAETASIPIVILSAKGEEADIVTGLELGADDYIPKPFSPRVLTARVRAVLRRRSQPPADETAPLKVHGLLIHPGRHEVTAAEGKIDLTHTEFRMLYFLASRPGWVFTRYQIIDAVRGEDYPVTDRSVDFHVATLRRKLGEYGGCIETVRGVGYRFKE
jgi:two-component system alkaline phosphatase synthesis response regulator PhoP